jgi:hypothetical protein
MIAPLPDQPAKQADPHDRRVYVWYGVTLALLLALGLFCWFVATPVMCVRREVNICMESIARDWSFPSGPTRHLYSYIDLRSPVQRLGGGHEALRMIRTYLAMPDWAAPNKYTAVALLGECGEEAIPVLTQLALEEEFEGHLVAVWALGRIGKNSIPVLIRLAASPDARMREAAAEALGTLGPDAKEAIPVLVGLEADKDQFVRYFASGAVWRISRGDSVFGPPPPNAP